jgi:outer membrane lipoprotein SlyB
MSDETLDRSAERYAERFSRYNLVAVVNNLDNARELLNTLSRQGIDATKTSLLGPAAEDAEQTLDPNAKDRGVIADVTKNTAVGSVAGGAAGGLAGFLAGLGAFAIPGIGPAVGTALWIGTVGGAVIGSGVGGMLGGVATINDSEAWELTYQLQEGRALVGVHSDDRADIECARKVFDGENVVSIGEFDENGKRAGS